MNEQDLINGHNELIKSLCDFDPNNFDLNEMAQYIVELEFNSNSEIDTKIFLDIHFIVASLIWQYIHQQKSNYIQQDIDVIDDYDYCYFEEKENQKIDDKQVEARKYKKLSDQWLKANNLYKAQKFEQKSLESYETEAVKQSLNKIKKTRNDPNDEWELLDFDMNDENGYNQYQNQYKNQYDKTPNYKKVGKQIARIPKGLLIGAKSGTSVLLEGILMTLYFGTGAAIGTCDGDTAAGECPRYAAKWTLKTIASGVVCPVKLPIQIAGTMVVGSFVLPITAMGTLYSALNNTVEYVKGGDENYYEYIWNSND